MWRNGVLAAFIILTVAAGLAPAQGFRTEETHIVETATRVLNEINADPLKGMPKSLLAEAQGVAIVPDVLKGGFIVGARHGRGVLMVRDDTGLWRAPVFITLTGGSFGWQIGVQSSDVVLVFRTRRSADAILKGKFTVGGDASVAAGPVGREATAGTDVTLKAEVYSYAQSRGLFAGLSLDGSVMLVDKNATTAYYGSPPMPGQPVVIPNSAMNLVGQLSRYTEKPGIPKTPNPVIGGPSPMVTPPITVTPVPKITPAPPIGLTAVEDARQKLTQSALKLDPLLPENWKGYLALPTEIFTGKAPPSRDVLALVVNRYTTISQDPRYTKLAALPEFRVTHQALLRYDAELRGSVSPLDLPPPPK